MPARSEPDPVGLPLLVSRGEALAAGLTRGAIAHRVRSGSWRRIAPGSYLRAPLPGAVDDPYATARTDHALRAVVMNARHPGSVIARASAAAVHGLPVVRPLPDLVELMTRADRSRRNGSRSGVRILASALAAHETLTIAGGALVTTLSRTIRDLAVAHVADGLAAADAVLRDGRLTREGLAESSNAIPAGHRGVRRAHLVALHADARRETPLESLSWLRFHEWSLPTPDLQATITDGAGRFVARVDFLWDGDIVGEADGRLKYRSPDDLFREKRREDALRALGFTVVRWGWADVMAGAALRATLTRLLIG